MSKRPLRLTVTVVAVIAFAVAFYNLPPIHNRLAPRLDDLRTQIKYFFNPPQDSVFVPTQVIDLTSLPTDMPEPSITPTRTPLGSGVTPEPSPTPTMTPTPLPKLVTLPGVKYVDQKNRWNYCGPANLTMALTFWGWKGLPGNTMDLRDQIAVVVKPGENDPNKNFIDRGKKDKNVMPYELADFVNDHTEFRSTPPIHGGDMELLRRLIAAGYPVVVEKGYFEKDYSGKVAWLGHYQFVTGYDDNEKYFIVQDTWNEGPNFHLAYSDFGPGWRSFNYLFFVVYPPDKEAQLMTLLGDYADPKWASRHALALADGEIKSLNGIDLFFAWFNKGTSHVQLLEYDRAAAAFDKAFVLYADLGKDELQRPYRIMWYQTWPYWAYYYTGRYQDVIGLADNTLYETISEPVLEESLYWRGLAKIAIGETGNGIRDLQDAVYLNPNFQAAIAKLQELGAPLAP